MQRTFTKGLFKGGFHAIPFTHQSNNFAVQSKHRPALCFGRMLGEDWLHSYFPELPSYLLLGKTGIL